MRLFGAVLMMTEVSKCKFASGSS